MPTLKPVKIIIAGEDRFSRKFNKQFRTLQKFGSGMNSMGKKMSLGLTVPIVLAGIAITKTAAKFESSLNKVEALTGATGDQMKQLGSLAKDLGLQTRFSATEAAEAMSFLGMAGWEVNEILAGTPALLDLAAASSIDLARAADIASNIMGAFEMEATQVSEIADILAATTASANVDMEMLAETMKYAGPIAHKFGVSLNDTAAAAGFLGNLGIQGSMAGTALRTMFVNLAAPTSAASKALSKVGVSVTDSKGNLRDFKDILVDFSKVLPTISDVKQISMLKDIFGKRAISASAAIISNIATGKKGFMTLAKNLANVSGRAKEMADIMNKGATGAYRRFKASLEGLSIAFGESGLLDSVTRVLNKLAGFFKYISNLSPMTLRLITVFGMFAASLGPVLAVVGATVSGIASMMLVVGAAGGVMAVIASPIAIGVAAFLGFIATVASVISISKNLDTWWGKLGLSWITLLNPAIGFTVYLMSLWDRLLPYFKLFNAGFESAFEDLDYGPIGDFFRWIGSWINYLLDKVLELSDSLIFGSLSKIATMIFTSDELEKAGFDKEGKQFRGEGPTEHVLRDLPGQKQEQEIRIVFDNLPGFASVIEPKTGVGTVLIDKGSSIEDGAL